jgi:predicted nucleotidyltransferase
MQPQLEKRLHQIDGLFAARPDVVLAYLFGSHARGTAGPLSDVDIAVLARPGMNSHQLFDLRLELIGDLMARLACNDVDVVLLNQASLALSYRVLRDGRLLYCRDEQVRIEYQAGIVSRYLDFKPIIERHERAILDRARRGELTRGHNPHRGALAHYLEMRQRFTRVR